MQTSEDRHPSRTGGRLIYDPERRLPFSQGKEGTQVDFPVLTFDLEIQGSVPDFLLWLQKTQSRRGTESKVFFENKCFSCQRDMERVFFCIKNNIDIFVSAQVFV